MQQAGGGAGTAGIEGKKRGRRGCRIHGKGTGPRALAPPRGCPHLKARDHGEVMHHVCRQDGADDSLAHLRRRRQREAGLA